MFIYSKYSPNGVEDPERLVNLLANEGVRAICLIDEFGLGVIPFLKTCKKRKVGASVAIPFDSFVEGFSEKQTGYLVAPSSASYEVSKCVVDKAKKDYISLLKQDVIEELSEKGVHCMIRKGDYCYEYLLKTKIKVMPVAYESPYIRNSNIHKVKNAVGISLEDNYFVPETVIFVEGVSQNPAVFLHEHENKNKCVDMLIYKEKRQTLIQAQEKQVK